MLVKLAHAAQSFDHSNTELVHRYIYFLFLIILYMSI